MGGAIGKRRQEAVPGPGSGPAPGPGPGPGGGPAPSHVPDPGRLPVPDHLPVPDQLPGPSPPSSQIPCGLPGLGSLPIGLGIPGTSLPAASIRTRRGVASKNGNSISEFNFMDLATNLTHRFSVLSGLSFISFVSVPPPDNCRRPRSKVSRKRWHPSTLQNEYAQCKTVWPVAQTEALFLPEFPVGIEEKLKLIFMGEVSRGAFGQVFHVKCASTNKEFAMKILSKSQVCSLDAVSQVKQEVMIQHVCSHHPFITPLTRFWQTRKLLIVMTEYVGYGELQQLWRSLGRLPENLLNLFVAEIALALDFLHNAGIIFRDLKMENILLDIDGHIKLIDFGLARWLSYSGRTNTICGTLQFMAPEVLKGEDYGHSADWWSLGIIAYSLFSGHYPVSGCDDHITMSSAVEKCSYLTPVDASPPLKSLLCALLDRTPSTRLHSLIQLKREAFFNKMDLDIIRDKKISPRKVLEEFIEGKSRPYFDDFSGLTSTPKKTHSGGPEIHRLATTTSLLQPSCNSLHKGIMGGMGDKARRSASSPLLSSPLMHPGRLGHHDALVKSMTSPGYNGAGVPILQSPLLRLARGQDSHGRGRRSQRAVSASALPTAVSPLLVNVRGNRRSCWATRTREGDRMRLFKGAGGVTGIPIGNHPPVIGGRSSSSNVAPGEISNSNLLSGMNGVYKKSASDECVRGSILKGDLPTISERKRTKIDIPLKQLSEKAVVDDGKSITACKPDPPTLSPLDMLDPPKEFFGNLITSTPKKESLQRLSSSPNPTTIRQSYRMATQADPTSRLGKGRLVNGSLVPNNNNYNTLNENDFDDTFETFPWISESIDS